MQHPSGGYTSVLVTGPHCSPGLAEDIVSRLRRRFGLIIIVRDDQSPTGRLFDAACRKLRCPHEAVPRKARREGLSLGRSRFLDHVEARPDLCIVFHEDLAGDEESRACAGMAIGAGIRTYLIGSEEARPVRLGGGDRRLQG